MACQAIRKMQAKGRKKESFLKKSFVKGGGNKTPVQGEREFFWWRFFHFLRKSAHIHLFLSRFVNDSYAKIVLLIVKNTHFKI